MKKILFICTGNTCRSPMAQGFFNHLAENAGLGTRAVSAGLAAQGSAATSNAVTAADEHSVDLSAHAPKWVTDSLIAEADIVLTMTGSQKQAVEHGFPTAQGKIHTLLEFVGEEGDIADPYGQSVETYRRCALQILTCVEKIVCCLRSQQKARD